MYTAYVQPMSNLVTAQGDQVTTCKAPTAQLARRPSLMRLAGRSIHPAKSRLGTVSSHETPKKRDMITEKGSRHATNLVTDRVTMLTDQQRRLIAACDMPKSLVELMALTGRSGAEVIPFQRGASG